MTRLALTLLAPSLAAPYAAQIQPAAKLARVGAPAGEGPSSDAGFEPFRLRPGQLGYLDGQTGALAVRGADGRAEWYPEHAAELARLGVGVQGSAPLA
jgi:hypothetical protein